MRSGWCPPDVPHARAHAACQERQDAGLLDPCTCALHGGHTRVTAPPPVRADEKPTKREAAA